MYRYTSTTERNGQKQVRGVRVGGDASLSALTCEARKEGKGEKFASHSAVFSILLLTCKDLLFSC